MSEKIKFQSECERREEETKERILKEGGVFYFEKTDPETKETKKFVNILGIELETYASKEEIEKLKQGLVLSKFDQEILREIAEDYKLRQPLMLEGDPGVGKTFLIKKFIRFIHGENAPILELVGTPRTSELEILGHWAPAAKAKKSKDPVVRDTIERYERLEYERLEEEFKRIGDEFDEKYKKLKEDRDKKEIDEEGFKKRLEDLQKWYQLLRDRYSTKLELLFQKSHDRVEWEFKEGALLQAYQGREGKGYILLIDEFNLIPSNYQQIFLQIGGEKGELSKSISFWGNTGKTIYERGKDTWVCFAANYPEKTPGRSEVVAPMTDRVIWRTITSEEADKKKDFIRETAGGRLTKRTKSVIDPKLISLPVTEPLLWDKVLDEELGEAIADTLALLDKEFINNYQAFGDEIEIKGAKRRRTQQLEFSARNLLRAYSYLDNFQIRNPETGLVDITETLKRAFQKYYLNRLASPEARETMENNFKEILEGTTGKVEYKGKVITRKELFDILVERASLTEEDRKKIENEKKKEKERQKEQLRYSIEDDTNTLLNNPDIPDLVKGKLSEIKEIIEKKSRKQ